MNDLMKTFMGLFTTMKGKLQAIWEHEAYPQDLKDQAHAMEVELDGLIAACVSAAADNVGVEEVPGKVWFRSVVKDNRLKIEKENTFAVQQVDLLFPAGMALAKVKPMQQVTINLGNYESFVFSCGVELPCPPQMLNDYFDAGAAFCADKVKAKYIEVKQMQAKKAG